jgi:phosphatidylglycerophosphate synthase
MEFGENQVSANTMSTLVRQIHEDWQISSWQEKIAHNMALGRLAVSAGAGVYLATACERPWLVGVTVGVAALSDKVDGLLARWGQRIRNGAATKLGIWADQMSDKAMNYLVGASHQLENAKLMGQK